MDATGTAPSLRVGLVTAHLTRAGGGVFTSVRQFAKALNASDAGVEAEVFGPALTGEEFSDWAPIVPRMAPPVGPAFFAYAPGLLKQMTWAGLDVVHLHGLWMHTSAVTRAFTRKTGKPHIISPHGMLDPWALHNSGWKKRLAAAVFENANIKEAACLHALNAAEAESIRDYGYGGPVCVIPNGVSVPPADSTPPKMPWWKKTGPEIKTLLYLGRIHPKKGLPNLLAGWSRIDPDLRRRWRLVIAGWDERRHLLSLRRMAKTLEIEASIISPGPLFGDEKQATFHYCDGFILPSLSEGLPMTLLEAWAYGKPVLMTPQCNLPEGFEAGAAVRIEATEESITRRVTQFMTMDDEERRQMGANGRALVSRKYAWPVIAAEMGAVYKWLAEEGPKPDSVRLR
jgi:poly(glycerol-phosphate) alpha-glucosyltransferase